MSDPKLDETAVFLVNVLKQLLYAFDRLDAIADSAVDGSPVKAFYLNSIYNYVALLFLLDGDKGKPMAGSAYPALQKHGLGVLLESMRELLAEPLGATTFGEVIRIFRNSAYVHPTYSRDDVKRVYKAVDMGLPENQTRWQGLLHRLYDEVTDLAVTIARSTGRPLSDFGITPG